MSVKWYGDDVFKNFDKAVDTALCAAVKIQLDAQVKSLINNVTGRLAGSLVYKTKAEKSNPTSPADEKDVIRTEPEDNQIVYGTNVEYAYFVEFGSSWSAPHPYLRKGYDLQKENMLKIIAEYMGRGLFT